jgi:hypothetical protein
MKDQPTKFRTARNRLKRWLEITCRIWCNTFAERFAAHRRHHCQVPDNQWTRWGVPGHHIYPIWRPPLMKALPIIRHLPHTSFLAFHSLSTPMTERINTSTRSQEFQRALAVLSWVGRTELALQTGCPTSLLSLKYPQGTKVILIEDMTLSIIERGHRSFGTFSTWFNFDGIYCTLSRFRNIVTTFGVVWVRLRGN